MEWTLLFLLSISSAFSKPLNEEACIVTITADADGGTQGQQPIFSSNSNLNLQNKTFLKLIVTADVVSTEPSTVGQIFKQKQIPINAYPRITIPLSLVCGSEATVETYMHNQTGQTNQKYSIMVSGATEPIEIHRELNDKSSDQGKFRFKVPKK